jgi:hypothetical protein
MEINLSWKMWILQPETKLEKCTLWNTLKFQRCSSCRSWVFMWAGQPRELQMQQLCQRQQCIQGHCCNYVIWVDCWSTLLQQCVPTMTSIQIVATRRVEAQGCPGLVSQDMWEEAHGAKPLKQQALGAWPQWDCMLRKCLGGRTSGVVGLILKRLLGRRMGVSPWFATPGGGLAL